MSRAIHAAFAYLAAIRVAREIHSLPEAVAPLDAFRYAQGKQWYGGGSIAPNQQPGEIVPLLDLLSEDPPHTVLEIGTDRGGTLFLWSRVAAADALLVSIDIRPVVGRIGRFSPFALVRFAFGRGTQRIVFVDHADSGDESTLRRVSAVLAGRAVDFLFIDGDHRYASVRRDFELYGPVVRPGGHVAFHDIAPTTTADTEGTAQYWQEFSAAHPGCHEFVDGRTPGYGLGVYRVPEL